MTDETSSDEYFETSSTNEIVQEKESYTLHMGSTIEAEYVKLNVHSTNGGPVCFHYLEKVTSS